MSICAPRRNLLSCVSRAVLAVCAASLLWGCGSGTSNTTAASSTPPPTPPATSPSLTLSTTTTSADSSVPSAATAVVTSVVSATDSKPLGSALSIPSDSTGFSTAVFAVDTNGNLLLAALTNSATTVLNAKSTAETLAVLNLGLPPDGVTAAQLTTSIDAVPSFATLVADIQASLAQGASPTNSQSVATDLATVLSNTLSSLYQQQSPAPFVVDPQTGAHPHTALPTETATGAPFQILGLSPSLPSLFSVYIDSASGDGGVNLKNTMPIAFAASSKDASGAPIDTGETLGEYSLLASLWNNLLHLKLSLTPPTPTEVKGNGTNFVVTVDQTPTEQTNLANAFAETSEVLLSKALDISVKNYPELESCALKGGQQIADAVLGANITIATSADLSAALAKTLTVGLFQGVVQSIISCTSSTLSASTVVKAFLANSAQYLAPVLGQFKLAYEFANNVYAASGPASKFAATWYYWNTSVAVDVCETGNQIGPCPGALTLNVVWTVSPIPAVPGGNYWEGSDSLTIANGNTAYTGNLINETPSLPCITDRTETGSGGFAAPVNPNPGTPFTFTVSIGLLWQNIQGAGCANPGYIEDSGSYITPPVVILATPTKGGYSLSTTTTYPPQFYYGNAQLSVTATGTLTGP